MNPHWRWLIPVVLPLLVLLIGGFTVVWPKWSGLQRIRAIRVDPIDASVLTDTRSELARLEAIVREQSSVNTAPPSLPASAGLVEDLAVQRGLLVVSSTSAQHFGGEARLIADERSRLRQVTVDGSYAQVVAYARALIERPHTLLARITLDQPAKDGKAARWTLQIVP